MIIHANYASIEEPNTNDFFSSFSSAGIRVFVQQFSLVCVNIFVLISGWFKITPSFKGVFKLVFQIFFIELLIIVYTAIRHEPITADIFAKLFIVGSSYWFVPAYFVLYCVSPVLNSFIETSSKK